MCMQIRDNVIYNGQPVNIGDMQMQQQAPGAAPGASVGDIKESLCYKLLTQGVKSTTIAAQKGLADPKDSPAMHKVASENVYKLFEALTRLADRKNLFDAQFKPSVLRRDGTVDSKGGSELTLREEGGRVIIGYGKDRQEVNTNLTVQALREQLANEIFADPDVLEADNYLQVLQCVVPGKNDDIETCDSFQRRCYEQALDRWVGIGADRLVNLTTANLGILAEKIFDEVGTTAGGMKSAVLNGNEFDDFEIVEHNADRFVSLLAEMDKQVNANRLESEDAESLVEALRKEAQKPDSRVDEKVVMDPDAQPGEGIGPIRHEATQPFRNFAADLIQMQDPIAHDTDLKNGNVTNGDRLAHAIDKHAETLAKLLIDREGAMQGLDEGTKELLTTLLDGKTKGLTVHGLGDILKLGEIAPDASVDDIARRIREKVSEDGLREVVLPGLFGVMMSRKTSLGVLGGALYTGASDALKNIQRTISEQLDDVFKLDVNPKPFEKMTIYEMFEDVSKPKLGSYTSFVKEALGHYFAALTDMNDEKVKGENDKTKTIDFGKYKEFSKGLEEDRRNMIAAMLRYAPAPLTDEAGNPVLDDDGKPKVDGAGFLKAALKGAGPLMQKILQGLDAGMLGDNDLAAVLKDMKKNLAPLPDEYVKAQLLDIVNRSGGKVAQIERVKTLGCASVAQAILCKVRGPGLPAEGKLVVVKLQRPNALVNFNREKALILKMAENTGMLTGYAGMIKSIGEEFDFLGEENNIREGEVYDTGFERVKAVKADPLVPSTPTSLVMECAPGETVSDTIEEGKKRLETVLQHRTDGLTAQQRADDLAMLHEQHDRLVQYQKDLSDLSIKWVTEGIFGSGKFHGDLHGGNIMVSGEKGVTLIDFGNVTKLTEKEQRAITKMAAAAAIGNKDEKNLKICANAFLDGLSELLPEDQRKSLDTLRTPRQPGAQPGLMADMCTILRAGTWENAGQRIFVALSSIQEFGQFCPVKIEIPSPIFKFSQAQMRLQFAIEEVTSLVRETSKQICKLTADPGFGLEKAEPGQKNSKQRVDVRFEVADKLVHNGSELVDVLMNDYSPKQVGVVKPVMLEMIETVRKNFADSIKSLPELPPATDAEHDLALADGFSTQRSQYAAIFIARSPKAEEMFEKLGDPDLLKRYREFRATNPEPDQHNATVTKLVDDFINAEILAIENQANALFEIEDPGDDKLKSFAESMGTAIKQNLKAASKCISLKLARATA